MLLRVQKHFLTLLFFSLLFAIGAQTSVVKKPAAPYGGKLELEFSESFGEDLNEPGSADTGFRLNGLCSASSIHFFSSIEALKAFNFIKSSLHKLFSVMSFRGPPSL